MLYSKAKAYKDQTMQQLYDEAKKIGIESTFIMTKTELMKALRNN